MSQEVGREMNRETEFHLVGSGGDNLASLRGGGGCEIGEGGGLVGTSGRVGRCGHHEKAGGVG